MKKNELSFILIRLLGIYFLVQSISSLSNLGWFFTINEMNNSTEYATWLTNIFTIFGPSLVYLVSGLLLLIFSKSIGLKLSSEANENLPVMENFKEIQAVLFSVAGILVVLFTIGQFIRSVISIVDISNSLYPDKYIRDRWFDFIANGLQMLVGILLIIRAPAISKFLTKIRGWNPGN
jgi:hypothetical protein